MSHVLQDPSAGKQWVAIYAALSSARESSSKLLGRNMSMNQWFMLNHQRKSLIISFFFLLLYNQGMIRQVTCLKAALWALCLKRAERRVLNGRFSLLCSFLSMWLNRSSIQTMCLCLFVSKMYLAWKMKWYHTILRKLGFPSPQTPEFPSGQ